MGPGGAQEDHFNIVANVQKCFICEVGLVYCFQTDQVHVQYSLQFLREGEFDNLEVSNVSVIMKKSSNEGF